MEGFEAFIAKHRLLLSDLCGGRDISINDYEIARRWFPEFDMFFISTRRTSYEKFRYAIAAASYMSHYMTDYPDLYSKFISYLDEEAWSFALKFCPFHQIFLLFDSINIAIRAIDEAVIDIHGMAASAGASILQGKSIDLDGDIRESIKVNIFKFSALYGLYIDLCQRVVALAELRNSNALRRARLRVLGKNQNAHVFTKDLRNFLVHYQMADTHISVELGAERKTDLYINSHELLWCGFEWKAESRKFLQSSDKLDVISMIENVRFDTRRVARLYQKIIYNKMPNEKRSYFYYRHEWDRFKSQSAALFDPAKIIRGKTTLLSRVMSDDLLSDLTDSSLSDEELRVTILNIINRNKILSNRLLNQAESEIRHLLHSRPRYPVGGRYFKGRPLQDHP